MATRTVKFKVSSKVSQYTITVGQTDVKMTNHEGSIVLKVRSDSYTLRWWMSGNPGKGITIVGKVGTKEIVKVSSKIPSGKKEGAGHKRFKVTA